MENHGSVPNILNSGAKLKVDNYFSATPQTAAIDAQSNKQFISPAAADVGTIGETPSQGVTRSINPDSARGYETVDGPNTNQYAENVLESIGDQAADVADEMDHGTNLADPRPLTPKPSLFTPAPKDQ